MTADEEVLDSRGETALAESLLDLCDPLFLYICRLHRTTRLQQEIRYGAERVRTEIKALFKGFAIKARNTALAQPLERVRLPLIFFVNEMIATSDLPFAGEWMPIIGDPIELTGGIKFFELLDAEFITRDPWTIDRLTIFYVCLTLGFRGKYADDRGKLDAYIVKTGLEIHEKMDNDETIKICPETYQHTIRRPIAQPVARSLAGIGVIAIALIALAFALNGAMYFLRTNALKDALNRFNHSVTSATVNK